MVAHFTIAVGDRFGLLTVTAIGPVRRKMRRECECVCACGGTRIARAVYLTSGQVQHCGCKSRANRSHLHTPKGVASPTFRSWNAMIGRCCHSSAPHFDHYGGRGITVCNRWRYGADGKSGFHCFLDDMGVRPSLGYSIDRRDGDGNYEPGNCRWATKREQCVNRKTSTLYDFNGQKLFLHEIAVLCGMPPERLRHRVLRAGWPLEKALVEPPRQGARTDLFPL